MILPILFLSLIIGGYSLGWVPLTDYPNAVCNDGSVAGYYYKPGRDNAEWVVHLEGGGFCYDETSCTDRAKNSPDLTSSKNYPDQINGTGMLSTLSTENPFWYDAQHVLIKYCSSDSFSGNNSNSILGWKFMGSHIARSVFDHLIRRRGLHMARQLILSGTSAGAEGLFPNIDAIRARISRSVRILGVIDSGWFLDYEPFRQQDCTSLGRCTEQEALKRGVPLWQPILDRDCDAQNPTDSKWECMLGYHVYPFITTPTIVVQYKFDSAALGHNGMGFPKDPAELAYALQASRNLTETLERRNVKRLFLASCYRHGLLPSQNWNKLVVREMTLDRLLKSAVRNLTQSFSYVDQCDQPNCNPYC